METPAQQCTRLIGALNELLALEATLIESGDVVALASVVDRAAPLVDRLAVLAPSADLLARKQAAGLIERRTHNLARFAVQLANTEEKLRETKLAHSRVSLVAPAYGSSPGAPSTRRLLAQG